jgi:acyl carrier protein
LTLNEIRDGLAEIVETVAGVERSTVTPQKSFAEDLGIDSLAMVEVIVAAEDRFGALIPDDDWPRFRTVDEAVQYIAQLTLSPGRATPPGE